MHHKRWLKYSNADSRVGSGMKVLCDYFGLSQIVRECTRYDYLLDLAITDIAGAKATVLSTIADHKGVLVKMPIAEVKETTVQRKVWHMRTADWHGLEAELGAFDWQILSRGTSEDVLNAFMEVLWTLLVKYIPQGFVENKRSTHPWLNSRCRMSYLTRIMQNMRIIFH